MTDTEQFYVKVCGCGVVHLSFGATVVNMTVEATLAVAETMRELGKEIRQRLRAAEDPVNADQAAIDPQGNVIYGRFS